MTDATWAKCPKCGYARKPDDFAPEWQCPRCEVIYEKYNEGSAFSADRHYDRPSPYREKEPAKRSESSSGLTRSLILIIVAIIFSAGFYAYFSGTGSNSMAEDATDGATSSEVVMYSARGCRYCELAKDFLTKHEVAFTEYNISSSEANYKRFKKLNGRGVPLIFIGNNRMQGFNATALEMALKELGII